eukprot:2450923-Pyramimonas_sp.AAC.1
MPASSFTKSVLASTRYYIYIHSVDIHKRVENKTLSMKEEAGIMCTIECTSAPYTAYRNFSISARNAGKCFDGETMGMSLDCTKRFTTSWCSPHFQS